MRQMSPRGRALAAAMFVVGGVLLTGAPSGSGGAGWVSMLIATATGLLVCAALGALGGRAPDRDFFDALTSVLGRGPGGLAAALLGAAALLLLVRDIAVITQFVGSNMITETPKWLIAASIALLAAAMACGGASVVGRWAELSALLAGAAIVVCAALAVRAFSAAAVLEGLRENADGIVPGAIGLFADSAGAVVFAAAALFPFGEGEKRRALPLAVGTLVGGVLLAALMALNVALLGAETLELFSFPTYHALRISGAEGILERMEALVIFPAVATSLIRAAAEMLFLVGAVAHFFPTLNRRKAPAFVAAAVGTVGALVLAPDKLALASAESALGGAFAALLAAVVAAVGVGCIIQRKR